MSSSDSPTSHETIYNSRHLDQHVDARHTSSGDDVRRQPDLMINADTASKYPNHLATRRKPCPSNSQQPLLSASSTDFDLVDGPPSPAHDDNDRATLDSIEHSALNTDEDPNVGTPWIPNCPTNSSIYFGKSNWRTILNLLLSIYSTVFSALWLLIAIIRPRYGRAIHIGGYLAPSTASTLFALFAKTIEISSVTIFVTFLGQVLTRRSISSRGVTVADMSMRIWMVQPGFLFTHWNHFKIVGFTILGGVSLLATLAILLFTTASDALVSPRLRDGGWDDITMYSLVRGSFANPALLQSDCKTPIGVIEDPMYKGPVCVSLRNAGLSFSDVNSWLDIWADIEAAGDGISDDLNQRPVATSSIFPDATVQGSWVQTKAYSVLENYTKFGRIINNVTLSMPHSGIYHASNTRSTQTGNYQRSIHASMVSPSSNVMCVNMNRSELAPLIYVEWPHAMLSNASLIPGQKIPDPDYARTIQLLPDHDYLNGTIVDDIFNWGSAYQRMPPVFPMWPLDYNSIVNVSVPQSDSIYLLFKAASLDDYTVCQMRAFLSPNCSTRYTSTISNRTIEAHCEDPTDDRSYQHDTKNARIVAAQDYRNVVSQWALTMSLNTGISNANSSMARLLSQFILGVPSFGSVTLNPLKPSLAEALSVMSCSMLSKSSIDSPARHYWDYASLSLDPGVWEPFNASINSQQYASGPSEAWQGWFYLILVVMCVGNATCLGYFLVRMGLVMDFTEPQNSFALAINSPCTEKLAGSCGGGPQGMQLKVGWRLEHNKDNHYYLRVDEDQSQRSDGYELRMRRRGSSVANRDEE
ncbi:hypothetical protein IFR05_011264 [Cadophora sp. M221]|nr:hypothetical protein IFR05_011264 [Cadophora sp. M221]